MQDFEHTSAINLTEGQLEQLQPTRDPTAWLIVPTTKTVFCEKEMVLPPFGFLHAPMSKNERRHGSLRLVRHSRDGKRFYTSPSRAVIELDGKPVLRRCSGCRKMRLLSDFYKVKKRTMWDVGLSSYCNECAAERDTAYQRRRRHSAKHGGVVVRKTPCRKPEAVR